jgi:hypothetical protein
MKKIPVLGDPQADETNPIAPHRRRGKPMPTVLCVFDTADIT